MLSRLRGHSFKSSLKSVMKAQIITKFLLWNHNVMGAELKKLKEVNYLKELLEA